MRKHAHLVESLEGRIAPAFAAVVDVGALDGDTGFKIIGAQAGNYAGFSVSDAGDVNGDGFDDLFIGAPHADRGELGQLKGAGFVVFGRAGGLGAMVDLAALNGSNGFKIGGKDASDTAGWSVSGAGDINGDGLDDLIIGAPNADTSGFSNDNGGASWVVFGRATAFPAVLNVSTLNGFFGFKLAGPPQQDYSGRAVSAAGYLNGDGFDDLLIGAPTSDRNPEFNSGVAYLVFGKAGGFTATLNLGSLNGTSGVKIIGAKTYDGLGSSLAAAGDVNGDGFDDVIIGAPGRNTAGEAYVIFGKPTGWTATLDTGALTSAQGFKIVGAAGDAAGRSVGGAGDLNRDGFDDLIIGGFSSPAYVVFGKADGFGTSLSVAALNGANGFALQTREPNGGQTFVDGIGDIDGDGFDDLVVGALYTTARLGAAFVVLGKAAPFAANISLFALNGADGFKLPGNEPQDEFGSAVSGAGDVNGDGFADLIVGAPKTDSRGVDAGAAYVVFGYRMPGVTIGDASAEEGTTGASPLAFTVSLSNPTVFPVEVQLATAAGSALAGTDFAALAPTTLRFAPGETSKTVLVSALGDGLHEADETFSLVASAASNATIADGTGVGTIRNDDAPPVITISGGGTVVEGNGGSRVMTVEVTLSAASALPASAAFSTVDWSAIAGSDFTAPAPDSRVSFAPGETRQTITIEVSGDTKSEAHETFSLVLADPVNATLAVSRISATIFNDDAALAVSDELADEGAGSTAGLRFNVGLEFASALPVSVRLSTVSGTATEGADFAAFDQTLTFAPGEHFRTITVRTVDDGEIEDAETFSLVLSEPVNAALLDPVGTGTIRNDDTALSIGDAAVVEGDDGTHSLVFTVSLAKPSTRPVEVRLATADGTALAGSDYTAISATTLTFDPGETSREFSIPVNGDAAIEPDETLTVTLSDAVHAAISRASATGTIRNDETAVRIGDASILEGFAGTRALQFTVSLVQPSALPVTVRFATTDGTATAGSDFLAVEETLTFQPGVTSQRVAISVLGDGQFEPSETFSVALSDAVNAVLEDGGATGSILNDDPTLVGSKKATFCDVDGDLVTVQVSRGSLSAENFILQPAGAGSQLVSVSLLGHAFDGANLTVNAKRSPGGDGLVNVGEIGVRGADLRSITVKGDIGTIDAGARGSDGSGSLTGLRLSAYSLGRFPVFEEFGGLLPLSEITGSLALLKVRDTIQDARIEVTGRIAAATIGGSLRNASIVTGGDIGSLRIGGDFVNGKIRSGGAIGTLAIGGDLRGSGALTAVISAAGDPVPATARAALAIGKISISGSVENARILAGYDRVGSAVNVHAGIGSVVVGRDWIASDLAAGIEAGADERFGTDDDALLPQATSLSAKIASVLIKGTVTGTPAEGDGFGFVAREIGAFKIGSVKFPLQAGPGNDSVAIGNDVRLREPL